MPLLITIRGNSCSGKTTLAKELQRRFGHGTMRLSQDMIRREMLYAENVPNPKSIPLLKRMLEYGHENAEIAILEGVMKADWYHELIVFARNLYKENLLSYYYDLPFEETLARRETKPNRQVFTDEKLHLWWTEHDYAPEWDEVILTEKDALSDTAEAIAKRVEALQKGDQIFPSFRR